ncbi:TNF receptor-associated factor 5-like [Amblyomma americanum]
MPPGSQHRQYTLVGLSVELDWRPLRFVKPIPSYRVCAACGLVRIKTALLPCSHTLCESCYQQCAQDGALICPLDGHQFEEDDVYLKKFPAEELLRREVRCWNEESGCGAVLPASQIAYHFQSECRQHSICCPKCSTAVVCTNVCAHWRSECGATPAPPASQCEGESGHKDESAILTYFQQVLEDQGGQLKALLARVLSASGANSDRLNEIGHGVNNCRAALRELWECIGSAKDTVGLNVAQGTTERRDCLKKFSDEIAAFSEDTKEHFIASRETLNSISNRLDALEVLLKDGLSKAAGEERDSCAMTAGGSERTTQQVVGTNYTMGRVNKVVPGSSGLKASVCEFVVKGIKSVKQRARLEDVAAYRSKEVYLRGYCMSPGVLICNRNGSLELRPLFLLHRGDMDDVVEWPLNQMISLLLVHPKKGVARTLAARTTDGPRSSCRRPQDGHVQHTFTSSISLSFQDLIKDGYVQDDQLRVLFELLP